MYVCTSDLEGGGWGKGTKIWVLRVNEARSSRFIIRASLCPTDHCGGDEGGD